MPFKPGTSGNPNGRPKGAENKLSSQVRETLTGFVAGKLADLDSLFAGLDNDEARLKYLIQLLPYVTPKRRETDIRTELTVEEIQFLQERERQENMTTEEVNMEICRLLSELG